jgi:aminodeoxyfutalosine deaminase
MSIESYLRSVPKAELHVHLEGSIQPATLLELARRNRVPLPADTVDGLRAWFVYRDFLHFVEIYGAIATCLKRIEDFELIAYAFGAEMARQNVRYAEVTTTPIMHPHRGTPHDVYFEGLTRGRARARRDFGVEIAWIFDIVREDPNTPRGREGADHTLAAAIDGMEDGVVALGLAGSEAGQPPEPFAPWFDRARAAGLHRVPHAGEHLGPESVRGAIDALGAERIGHGVRAIEDPTLVALLAERRIPLEVCPTSNIRLGVFPNLASHPLRRLHEAGVSLTINSDDPPLFNTSLNDEVVLLSDTFGLGIDAIDAILLNAVRSSFLPPERKSALESEIREEMAALKPAHLQAAESRQHGDVSIGGGTQRP